MGAGGLSIWPFIAPTPAVGEVGDARMARTTSMPSLTWPKAANPGCLRGSAGSASKEDWSPMRIEEIGGRRSWRADRHRDGPVLMGEAGLDGALVGDGLEHPGRIAAQAAFDDAVLRRLGDPRGAVEGRLVVPLLIDVAQEVAGGDRRLADVQVDGCEWCVRAVASLRPLTRRG